MLDQRMEERSDAHTEVINTLLGYEDNEKNKNKQLASQRLLAARRAIEEHRELRELQQDLEDSWLLED
ncbi:MAG: PA3496 family putative envelope integrity protein [Pseudomonadales bacterium]